MCGEAANYIIDAWISDDEDDDPLDPQGACEDHFKQLIGITSLDAVEVVFEAIDPDPDWVCQWDFDDDPARYSEYLASQVSDIPRLTYVDALMLSGDLNHKFPDADCYGLVFAANHQPEQGGPIAAGLNITSIERITGDPDRYAWMVTTAGSEWIAGFLDGDTYRWRRLEPDTLSALRATLGNGWLTATTTWDDLERLATAVEATNR